MGMLILIGLRPIEEKNPLKQGLKQGETWMKITYWDIEEKNPLKQGLKPSTSSMSINEIFHWREESIKTRIETSALKLVEPKSLIEEKNPLKQGLKQITDTWVTDDGIFYNLKLTHLYNLKLIHLVDKLFT